MPPVYDCPLDLIECFHMKSIFMSLVQSSRTSNTNLRTSFLSPGQTDRQVVASGRRYTQVAKKKHFKAGYPLLSLPDNRLMNVTQLALTWVGWLKGEKHALTCVQI